jgi:hypothetical protein
MSDTDDILGTPDNHPSYGVIVLGKLHSTGSPLVGSPLVHQSMVSIEIKNATKRRQYGKDHFYGDKSIVRLVMSEAQWAQFVSSFGVGGGTPVTLNYKPEDGYTLQACGDPPHITTRGAHTADVEQAMAKAKNAVAALDAAVKELTNKPKSQVKAADIEAVSDAAIQVRNWLTSNLPFVHQCFEEAMEKTVAAAKAEVVGFTTGMLIQAGLEHLGANVPRLEVDGDGGAGE